MKGVRPLVVRGWVQAVKGAGCDEVWTIRGVCGCRGSVVGGVVQG